MLRNRWPGDPKSGSWRKGCQNPHNPGTGKTLWKLGCLQVYTSSVKKSQSSQFNPAHAIQARAHAISVLGHAQAAYYLTGFPVASVVAFA